jgi:hypothetical protein
MDNLPLNEFCHATDFSQILMRKKNNKIGKFSAYQV